MDYVLDQPNFIPSYYGLVQFSLHRHPMQTRYTFTSETDPVYIDGIYICLVIEEPGRSLEELTQILIETLHDAAAEAYPHTQSEHMQRSGSMPQNNWYDEECREMRATLQREVLLGVMTHRQLQIAFLRLLRQKKRTYLAQLERELYHLF